MCAVITYGGIVVVVEGGKWHAVVQITSEATIAGVISHPLQGVACISAVPIHIQSIFITNVKNEVYKES